MERVARGVARRAGDLLMAQRRRKERHRQNARADQQHEAAIPAQLVNRVAHRRTGGDRTAQITEQPGESGCRARSLLRRELQRLQADQHHRAVDQEADGHQRDHVDGRVAGRVQPVHQRGNCHQKHEHHAGQAAIALKDFVRHPAAQQRARNARPLVQK